ncbi:DUF1818 family protein [Aphanothece sacrum]|uniref:DUF1818 domain-containing protein n=1 Tax=Aphanothece sacrum FPU1 TaxID=1920663 RepID=A0A401IN40_APHSA|nr:DUF1818 family protein [Aphanothece sacrum]GBF82662.1 hypothetical protein AsFPU1_4095 [Aphanothece sacrum FPU1]GBF84546.1 hypothetical protein AsFPU3_1596 [Aphanothece sacrum FPU3]
MSDRILKKGRGWRLGWNPQVSTYQGLVGGDDWAIELTAAEFNDFCRLVQQLADTMTAMTEELMDQERIACEAESDKLWLEVEGYPDAYCLRLIVNGGRRCEGNWPEGVVKELIEGIQNLTIF